MSLLVASIDGPLKTVCVNVLCGWEEGGPLGGSSSAEEVSLLTRILYLFDFQEMMTHNASKAREELHEGSLVSEDKCLL